MKKLNKGLLKTVVSTALILIGVLISGNQVNAASFDSYERSCFKWGG